MSTETVHFESLDHKLSQDYTQIVLGMDVFYRKNLSSGTEASLDHEGLVPINLTKETPNSYSSWNDIFSDLRDLRSKYSSIQSEVRRNYMQQQIGSLLTLARWRSGEEIPFRENVRALLYVNENPFSEAERKELHHRLESLLIQRGFSGTLEEKVKKWEQAQHVPSQQVESVLKDLLSQGKERVVQKMFKEMEGVEVTPVVVTGVPYSAYCDYVGGRMYINGDLSYTYESLKHLVTHESFPGHTTHMKIRELGVQSGDIPLDAGLVITNTASSSVFEGIGDNGIDFIDWTDSLDDEIYKVYQEIKAISGMSAAHMIHAEGKSDEEVLVFLRDFAFGEENWIQSRLRFFKHTLRAPFIYSYWRGNEAVKEIYNRLPEDRKLTFYEFLYKNMLSADTVKQFR
ncbi:hypothetical protein DFO73_102294 [Cytobacillus oceanisediminis]|uniref:DUF885 domain-containing protein n=1 Tax=Cytobacillus oceanisediminis TaxID=665099 RepID=A0A2V3A3Y0_9BACI|nr:hypothetical protein [Cytobacillus oceanisediminis]PWW31298.1 hypothetical protein DFO73_102294 [Cytobacillus oceanisediminis]